MRVAVIDDYHEAFVRSRHLQPLNERADIDVWTTAPRDEEDLLRRIAECEVVVAIRERTRFTRQLLAGLPALRFIAQTGGHVYHIDIEAATEGGVAVAMDPRPNVQSHGTCELTFGLMLSAMRGISRHDALLHTGGWELPYGRVLAGKVLGVVGLGRVGRQVASIGQAFGMRVLAWSPHMTAERARGLGVDPTPDLDTLLAIADVVTIHVPLSTDTVGLIDGRRLGLMRREAVLINTSRGPVVDEEALVAALQAGHVAAAGLDVFDREPLPQDHPLRGCVNTVLTPHAGWVTDEAYDRFAASAAYLVKSFLDGRPEGVVNPAALIVTRRPT